MARKSAKFTYIRHEVPMLISANLGFLFTDLPLADRVLAARDAGFDAVEFHDQVQSADIAPLRAALGDMPVMALNTHMGPTMGRAALSRPDFAQDIAQAVTAAQEVGARAIHIVAGKGGDRATYLNNLEHALARTPCPLLIEPISAPDYFLSGFAQAEAVLNQFNDPKLRIMADWFHLRAWHTEAGAQALLARLWPRIGHVQLARAGDRGAPCPDTDPEIARLLPYLDALDCPAIGLEYRPDMPPCQAISDTLAALRP
jgi:hydroxypyruvate isomerase